MSSRPPFIASRTLAALLAFPLLALACTGNVGDGTSPGQPAGGASGPGGPGGGPGAGPAVTAGLPPSARTGACKGIDPGPSPLRLPTRIEYDNTVRDLLGDMARGVAAVLPDDPRPIRGYANDAIGRAASDELVAKLSDAADKLATSAVAQLPSLLAGCDPARDGETTCL